MQHHIVILIDGTYDGSCTKVCFKHLVGGSLLYPVCYHFIFWGTRD